VPVEFSAIAHALPSRHLSVFVPPQPGDRGSGEDSLACQRERRPRQRLTIRISPASIGLPHLQVDEPVGLIGQPRPVHERRDQLRRALGRNCQP